MSIISSFVFTFKSTKINHYSSYITTNAPHPSSCTKIKSHLQDCTTIICNISNFFFCQICIIITKLYTCNLFKLLFRFPSVVPTCFILHFVTLRFPSLLFFSGLSVMILPFACFLLQYF